MSDVLIAAHSHADETVAFVDLWRRRAHLADAEISSVYAHVRRALRGYFPCELRALAEDKEELIAQFIYFRVLRLDRDPAPDAAHDASTDHANTAPSNAYAICAYFRHYLIDCLRSAAHRRNVSIEVEGVGAELESHVSPLHDPVESVLVEYGLNERRTRQKARAFVDALSDADRLILAGCIGTHAEEEGGLKALADRHRLASYQYHARKLGVRLKKSASPEDFARTRIGEWMREALGIEIVAENHAVILVVLKLLALEANA